MSLGSGLAQGQHGDREATTDAKPELLVQADRVGVLVRACRKYAFGAILYTRLSSAHESWRPSRDAMGRRGAHGADLRPAVEAQALASHGDELAIAADPDVVTKLDSSVQEWTGFCLRTARASLKHHLHLANCLRCI